MADKKCKKCEMPITGETECKCDKEECFHCCECGEDCQCGCYQKR